VESNAIYRQDKQQREEVSRQHTEFKRVLDQNQNHFEATIKKVEDVLKKTNKAIETENEAINTETGGDSICYLRNL
jgi:ribosomal protein S8